MFNDNKNFSENSNEDNSLGSFEIELNSNRKKFSILNYQEELLQKINESKNIDNNDLSFIFIKFKNDNIYKIDYTNVDFIEHFDNMNLLPMFKNEIIGISNIKEKEYLIVDIESYITQKTSIYRDLKNINKNIKLMLLKHKRIAFLVQVISDVESLNNLNIEELNIENILIDLKLM